MATKTIRPSSRTSKNNSARATFFFFLLSCSIIQFSVSQWATTNVQRGLQLIADAEYKVRDNIWNLRWVNQLLVSHPVRLGLTGNTMWSQRYAVLADSMDLGFADLLLVTEAYQKNVDVKNAVTDAILLLQEKSEALREMELLALADGGADYLDLYLPEYRNALAEYMAADSALFEVTNANLVGILKNSKELLVIARVIAIVMIVLRVLTGLLLVTLIVRIFASTTSLVLAVGFALLMTALLDIHILSSTLTTERLIAEITNVQLPLIDDVWAIRYYDEVLTSAVVDFVARLPYGDAQDYLDYYNSNIANFDTPYASAGEFLSSPQLAAVSALQATVVETLYGLEGEILVSTNATEAAAILFGETYVTYKNRGILAVDTMVFVMQGLAKGFVVVPAFYTAASNRTSIVVGIISLVTEIGLVFGLPSTIVAPVVMVLLCKTSIKKIAAKQGKGGLESTELSLSRSRRKVKPGSHGEGVIRTNTSGLDQSTNTPLATTVPSTLGTGAAAVTGGMGGSGVDTGGTEGRPGGGGGGGGGGRVTAAANLDDSSSSSMGSSTNSAAGKEVPRKRTPNASRSPMPGAVESHSSDGGGGDDDDGSG